MRIRSLLLAALIIGFAAFCATQLIQVNRDRMVDKVETQSKTIDLRTHQLKGEELQRKLDAQFKRGKLSDQQLKELQEENQKYQQETEELKRQLEAKAKLKAAERLAQAARAVSGAQRVYASSNGDCGSWLASAGVTDLASAHELIRRESNCNPYAVNSSSGACGVAQELPCGKSGCKLGDGACQVKWMASYVKQRYGSWSAALAFHSRNSWY